MLSQKYFSPYDQFSRKHKLKTIQSNDTFQSKFHTMQTAGELHLMMKALGSSKISVPIYQVHTYITTHESQVHSHFSAIRT